MQEFGKIILAVGLITSLTGGIVLILAKTGITKIPGDLHIKGENWQLYLPIGTSILLSILLTAALGLIKFFSGK